MDRDNLQSLTDSAARIADGEGVDWQAQRLAQPALQTGLAGLERVARIASAWRGLGVVAPTEAEERGDAPLFLWGDLEVRELLGEGSFGEVFRAFDPTLEREVALKLRADDGDEVGARRALEEARRLAQVRHRHVLAVYGADVHDGRAGFWAELLRGETLERVLQQRGRLSAEEASLVGLDLVRALAAVHAQGLVHGDLKAANVMREEGGRIVLMDFGSAARAGSEPARLTGSPLTLAPEVLAGGAPTPASDLYALGALLFRLATSEHPIEATTLAELRDKAARGEHRSLRALRPDLPVHFVAALERALAADPAERFAEAGELESALLAPSLASAHAALREPEAPARPRRSVWPWGVAAAAALVFVLWRALSGPSDRTTAAAIDSGDPAVSTEATPAKPTPQNPGASQHLDGASPGDGSAASRAAAVSAEAVLWRVRDGRRVPMADQGAVAPGDQLHLEFAGSEPLYVYVLDEDSHGETFTLFPVRGSDLANPVPAGEHRLPGAFAGQAFDWVVTSSGGREDVLVVASRRPVAALEASVAALAPAASGRTVTYAPVADEAIAALRGIGGLAPAPISAGDGRLAKLARDLIARGEPGVWVRRVTLSNP